MQKNTKKYTIYVVKGALIAAIYAVLTLVLAPISYGNIGIEFRVAEALTILPIFTSAAIPGLTVGCVVANLIGMSVSGLGMADVVFGSLATLIAAIATYLFRKVTFKGFPLLSFLPPIIANAIVVGFELSIILTDVFPSFLWAFFVIGVGEAVVVFVLGTPLYLLFEKDKKLNKLIRK